MILERRYEFGWVRSMPKWGDSTKNIREIRGIRGLGLYFSGFGALLFVVWGFTFRGLELYFSWFGTLLFVDSKWDSWFGTIFWGEMVGK